MATPIRSTGLSPILLRAPDPTYSIRLAVCSNSSPYLVGLSRAAIVRFLNAQRPSRRPPHYWIGVGIGRPSHIIDRPSPSRSLYRASPPPGKLKAAPSSHISDVWVRSESDQGEEGKEFHYDRLTGG